MLFLFYFIQWTQLMIDVYYCFSHIITANLTKKTKKKKKQTTTQKTNKQTNIILSSSILSSSSLFLFICLLVLSFPLHDVAPSSESIFRKIRLAFVSCHIELENIRRKWRLVLFLPPPTDFHFAKST